MTSDNSSLFPSFLNRNIDFGPYPVLSIKLPLSCKEGRRKHGMVYRIRSADGSLSYDWSAHATSSADVTLPVSSV